jgi:hypothetical protein
VVGIILMLAVVVCSRGATRIGVAVRIAIGTAIVVTVRALVMVMVGIAEVVEIRKGV